VFEEARWPQTCSPSPRSITPPAQGIDDAGDVVAQD